MSPVAASRDAHEALQLSLFDFDAVGADPSPAATVAPAAGGPTASTVSHARPQQVSAAPPRADSLGAFDHPRASRSLTLAGTQVAFEFRRARRRSIGFVVGPEGLSVSAPRWVGMTEVEAALREKSRWILRKLQEQQERARRVAQARVQWRDGTSLPFLGETLVVVIDPRATGAVLNTQAQALPGVARLSLHVGLPQECSPGQLRDAVQSWLQRQARRIFEERCAIFAQRLGVRVRRIALSSAATRWGSASADGSVRLNWRLVHFALPVVDYVVAHELAHLREMNHSAAFWDIVRSVVPQYEAARTRLEAEILPVLD